MKIIWALMGLAAAAFLTVILNWGVAPKAVRLIDPSSFTEAEPMGSALYVRLRQQLEANPVVIMGGQPADPVHQKIALGFLNRAAQDGRAFDEFIVEPGTLPTIESGRTEMDINDSLVQLATRIAALPQGQRLFVYTSLIYSSHQLADNAMARLEKALESPVMAISIAQLAIKPEEIEKLEPPCKGLSDDRVGTAKFGCMIATRSRMVSKRKIDLSKFTLVLNQEGSHDYLALVRAP